VRPGESEAGDGVRRHPALVNTTEEKSIEFALDRGARLVVESEAGRLGVSCTHCEVKTREGEVIEAAVDEVRVG
jgi:hypothetical protein